MFGNVYKNKKVLIIGNTGFKGAWLTMWLIKLEAKVFGISKDIPTTPSLFEALKLQGKIDHIFLDIRDATVLLEAIDRIKPDFLFHLAAQSIVSISYVEPLETVMTNALGTANILESLRVLNQKCIAVVITSDKAYDNVEQVWGYRENDALGGKDIYSGSKGAAELILNAYFHSFFKKASSNIKLGIARAGNVIGGGDWAKDRIVVDCMLAWSNKKKVIIRNPYATRPWQHVLEPLSGYLSLGQALFFDNGVSHGEAFNFGSHTSDHITVLELIKDLSKYWGHANPSEAFVNESTGTSKVAEAKLLNLNCDKALFYLKWHSAFSYHDTIKFTSQWYRDFYCLKKDICITTENQIKQYTDFAKAQALPWTE